MRRCNNKYEMKDKDWKIWRRNNENGMRGKEWEDEEMQ